MSTVPRLLPTVGGNTPLPDFTSPVSEPAKYPACAANTPDVEPEEVICGEAVSERERERE